MFRSLTIKVGLNGMTTKAPNALANTTIGASANTKRSACSGTISSLNRSLTPSAIDCAQPCQPPAVGLRPPSQPPHRHGSQPILHMGRDLAFKPDEKHHHNRDENEDNRRDH